MFMPIVFAVIESVVIHLLPVSFTKKMYPYNCYANIEAAEMDYFVECSREILMNSDKVMFLSSLLIRAFRCGQCY